MLHVRNFFSLSLLLGITCLPALTSSPANAVDANSPEPFSTVKLSEEQPVTLEAEQLDYDQKNQLIIAQGKVEISQGDTIVQADTLVYDQKNDLVYAEGNVAVLEPSGNVYFAEQVELQEGMKLGVVKHIRARFSDNSLFAADEGERKSEFITELTRAVYSPCSILCDDGTPKEPLWQVKAGKAVIDQDEQTVTYEDASMELYGFPVLYTPYLSHAMPGADSKTGILAPEYRSDDNLGHVVQVPFYWAISPDKDATVTYMHTTEEAPVLIGEYRQRFNRGQMKFNGSITRPDDRDALGNPASGKDTRGHLFAEGTFIPSDTWQYGFDINRTTDDTYLRRYEFNYDPLLTTRFYGEGFNFIGNSDRSYIVAEALAFQGLQQQDDQSRSPLVMPVIDAYYQTLPMWHNSRFTLTGGMRALERDIGADSQRISMSGSWMVPHVTEDGHIFELETQLRADAYNVDNHLLPNGSTFDGTETRVVPQASLTWRYPLAKQMEESSVIIEPIVSAIVSPNDNNEAEIPNEDSAIPEFSDTNLFSDNRFPGYDRVEEGPRMNYGVRTQWQPDSDTYMTALIGQSYRFDETPLFPLSSDLNSRFSDYVGKVTLSYDPVDIAYRFRLDEENLSLNRNEIQAGLRLADWISLGANYLNLKNDPIITSREELSGHAYIRLAEHWFLNMNAHRDLLTDNMINMYSGLTYQNECITVKTLAGRNYTEDRDYRESTSFKVQVLLKNLN